MPQGIDPNPYTTASVTAMSILRRERDSALRNLEFWKKRAAENMAKEHANGFTTGVVVASGVYGIIFVIVAMFTTGQPG